MTPLSYDECDAEEQAARDFAMECAEEDMRDQGIDDEEFIGCVLEDIRDGHSVAVGTLR